MGDEVDQGTKEPGIVGNWYIDLKEILDNINMVLSDFPATLEAEILVAIECDLMASGHRLAAFIAQYGDMR